jgi:hypothetical protein
MGNLREIWTADVSTRKELLSQAAALLGGKSALGRRLGFRDGAFVGQMIRGERPITEKTMLALSRVNELAALFKPSIDAQLIEKLKKLPPSRAAEVMDFVDFLTAKEERAAPDDVAPAEIETSQRRRNAQRGG